MKVEIKHRYTGAVLFACDVPDENSGMAMRHALEKATEAGANLAGVNLTGANLTGVNLASADLTDVRLADANLTRTNLAGVNLTGANLTSANLADANLADANLTGVNLADASLTGAKNTPLIVYGLRWQVQITGFGQMKIGCQKHSVSAWQEFSHAEISDMSTGALEFWNKHKTMLLALCESYKHEESK